MQTPHQTLPPPVPPKINITYPLLHQTLGFNKNPCNPSDSIHFSSLPDSRLNQQIQNHSRLTHLLHQQQEQREQQSPAGNGNGNSASKQVQPGHHICRAQLQWAEYSCAIDCAYDVEDDTFFGFRLVSGSMRSNNQNGYTSASPYSNDNDNDNENNISESENEAKSCSLPVINKDISTSKRQISEITINLFKEQLQDGTVVADGERYLKLEIEFNGYKWAPAKVWGKRVRPEAGHFGDGGEVLPKEMTFSAVEKARLGLEQQRWRFKSEARWSVVMGADAVVNVVGEEVEETPRKTKKKEEKKTNQVVSEDVGQMVMNGLGGRTVTRAYGKRKIANLHGDE